MTLEARKERAKKILARLQKLHPDAHIALKYGSNWELLVAVILSAQCTDVMVNKVTDKLFKKYKKLDDYVNADQKEFEVDIKSTGFYHNKTNSVLKSAKIVKEKYKGKVPDTMEEILKLPGVARKTANVVLGNAYGIVKGIAVDTHVKRLSKQLGLTDNTDPVKIERDLMAVIPQKNWFKATYMIIDYGRQYCKARAHDHSKCPLAEFYI